MIYFLTGKPGGGKSYYALTLIIEEIVKGNRIIVTNLALKLPQLQVLLLERYESIIKDELRKCADNDRDAVRRQLLSVKYNVLARIRVLGKDQVGAFFLHRRLGLDIPPVTQIEEKQGKYPDFASYIDGNDTGVMYVIDETHEYFNARCWQSNSLSIFNYLAKHRHYNDEVIFISQNPEQVDKQLKLQVENWLYILNTGNDLWGRGFRGRLNHSKVHWYKEEPPRKMGHIAKLTAVKVEDVPIEITKGDHIRIGDCYRTLGCAREGVGGRVAEDKGKVRGRNPLWIVVPVVGVVAVVWAVPYLIEWGTTRALGGLERGVAAGMVGPSGVNPPVRASAAPRDPKSLVLRAVCVMRTPTDTTLALAYYDRDSVRVGPVRWYQLPPGVTWADGTLEVARGAERRTLPAPAMYAASRMPGAGGGYPPADALDSPRKRNP